MYGVTMTNLHVLMPLARARLRGRVVETHPGELLHSAVPGVEIWWGGMKRDGIK